MEVEVGAQDPHTQRQVISGCSLPSYEDSSLVLLCLLIIIFVLFTIIS